MTLERIRKAIHRRPFRPFLLHLADGQVLRVHHPDFATAVASELEEVVIVIQPDLDYSLVDPAQVVSIQTEPARRGA